MSLKHDVFALAVVAAMAAPIPAWAFGGGGSPGCSNLPDYARAAGTLEGLSSCDMSIAQARAIVAAHDGYQPAVPARYRRHRVQPVEQ